MPYTNQKSRTLITYSVHIPFTWYWGQCSGSDLVQTSVMKCYSGWRKSHLIRDVLTCRLWRQMTLAILCIEYYELNRIGMSPPPPNVNNKVQWRKSRRGMTNWFSRALQNQGVWAGIQSARTAQRWMYHTANSQKAPKQSTSVLPYPYVCCVTRDVASRRSPQDVGVGRCAAYT
jgi:hypothetical protein